MKLLYNPPGGGGSSGSRWSLINLVLTTLSVTVLLHGTQNVDGAAVMSVDLGSEWIKIGIVSVSLIAYSKFYQPDTIMKCEVKDNPVDFYMLLVFTYISPEFQWKLS